MKTDVMHHTDRYALTVLISELDDLRDTLADLLELDGFCARLERSKAEWPGASHCLETCRARRTELLATARRLGRDAKECEMVFGQTNAEEKA